MKLVVKKEIDNYKEMAKYIEDNNLINVDYSFAVLGLFIDSEGKVILQRRGPKARDAMGKLAEIGGAFIDSDETFRKALEREIREEIGNDASIKIEEFIGGGLEQKYDSRTGRNVNWLFFNYKCIYEDGEIKINEPGKSLGYECFNLDKLPEDEMLDTTKFFLDYYKNRFNKCYSYAMGVNETIYNLGDDFKIEEDEGDFEVTFTKGNEDKWEEFIINNMSCGFWNEYLIDDEIRFIFKDENGTVSKYVLSRENNGEILDKCRSYAEAEFKTVHGMYLDTPFYADKIEGIKFFD